MTGVEEPTVGAELGRTTDAKEPRRAEQLERGGWVGIPVPFRAARFGRDDDSRERRRPRGTGGWQGCLLLAQPLLAYDRWRMALSDDGVAGASVSRLES
jgi:hypothetical protein